MWQIALNQLGIAHFEFNTYLVSVLVIFFLQMNYKFPTVGQTSVGICSVVSDFKPVVRQFFEFYGNHYDIPNHVISTQTGDWRKRRIRPQQEQLSAAEMQLVSSTHI